MGDQCGGLPVFHENGLKDCSGCALPHFRGNYGAVVERLAAWNGAKGCG
jgi:hypothetical protein